MARSKKSNKKSTSNTSRKKRTSHNKSTRINKVLKFIHSQKGIYLILGIILFFIFVSFIIPVEYEVTETDRITFKTENVEEPGLELGTYTTTQEGKDGLQENAYKYSSTLFNYLFRKDSANKTLMVTNILSEPVDRIILKGTRKWQYMMCSDGSYRYYTDEEFKNPYTGFTSSSPDDCKENGQGKKLSLADTPEGQNNPTQPSSYLSERCNEECQASLNNSEYYYEEARKHGDNAQKIELCQSISNEAYKEYSYAQDQAEDEYDKFYDIIHYQMNTSVITQEKYNEAMVLTTALYNSSKLEAFNTYTETITSSGCEPAITTPPRTRSWPL